MKHKVIATNKNRLNIKSVKTGAGFTLIELLVVMAIISLLASVILIALNSARVKARDAKRMSDMRQLQKALELYYDDNDSYPPTPLSTTWYGYQTIPSGSCGVVAGLTGAGGYIPNLAPKYLSVLPTDPNPATGCWYGILYRSDGVGYKLLSTVPEFTPEPSSPFYDPARPWASLMLCSGTAECTW